MAEITLRLRHNPRTGKREILIGYESEPDDLPHEHERDHRALVEELLGIQIDDDKDEIVIERVSKGEVHGTPATSPVAEREKQKNYAASKI